MSEPLLGRSLGAAPTSSDTSASITDKPRRASRADSRLPPPKEVADDFVDRHPLHLGHRGDSFRRTLGRADDDERHGGWTLDSAPSDAQSPQATDVTSKSEDWAPGGQQRAYSHCATWKRP